MDRGTGVQAQASQPAKSTGAARAQGLFESREVATHLPKAGGTVRGMGENASVDAFRGGASMSIPLPMKPGRGNFPPPLSLSYQSGAGNGLFGSGWSLGLGRVSRRTDRGVPRYHDAHDGDCFILDGVGELVRSDDSSGAFAGGEYDGFEVRCYRPRVEGLFSRVEWWRSRQEPAESFWRVLSPANVTTLYGYSAAARHHAPDSPAMIAEWLAERSWDDRGNAVEYQYHADTTVMEPFPDTGDLPRAGCAMKYPAKVLYGNTHPVMRRDWSTSWLPPDSRWLFEVAFDYGPGTLPPDVTLPAANQPDALGRLVQGYLSNTDPAHVTGPEAWAGRRDAFSSFRYGFECRYRRLCRRIVGYHHFGDAVHEGLTWSLELAYDDSPFLGKLLAVTQVCYQAGSIPGSYRSSCTPPLQFCYSEAVDMTDSPMQDIASRALPDTRKMRQRSRLSWLDLDAEGAPGVLVEHEEGHWLYHRNQGMGRFAPGQVVASPAKRGGGGGKEEAQLLDLGADGQLDYVEFGRPSAGFRERSHDERWEPFQPFAHGPSPKPSRAAVHWVDLDGDGRADRVTFEHGGMWREKSLGESGFATKVWIPGCTDERIGPPKACFSSRDVSFLWVDMTGDGLSDLVRVRNGEVCFWPNLGHGRFGPRITALQCASFDGSGRFTPSRLRLVDLDGSGPADVLYLGIDGVRAWRSYGGNGFASPIQVPFPPVDDPEGVSVLDLLANGTSCLVWESASAVAGTNVSFMPLSRCGCGCSGSNEMEAAKPHLLTLVRNNMGSEIEFHYTSSARLCLEDRDGGKPWLTKLGFPVPVVSHLEYRDMATGRITITRYRYRHGYFDGEEREFRGFAFVEQHDSVSFDTLQQRRQVLSSVSSGQTPERGFHVPPVVTRTWYHTGAVLPVDGLGRALAREYFSGDPHAVLLPDTILAPEMSAASTREAIVALSGAILRQETYSGEFLPAGADREPLAPLGAPYLVSERSYRVDCLQAASEKRRGVFHVHPREQMEYHYERQVDDPRVTHELHLEVDDWGHTTHMATIAYGRRWEGRMRDAAYLTAEESKIQAHTHVQFSHRGFTAPVCLSDPVASAWLVPVMCEERTWELTGIRPSSGTSCFAPPDFTWLPDGTPALPVVDYVSHPAPDGTARCIEHLRHTFWKADQSGPLALGLVEAPALPHRSFRLAFPRDVTALLEAASGSLEVVRLLQDAGHAQFAGQPHWWAQSSFQRHDDPFRQPTSVVDAFGNQQRIIYDPWSLLITRIEDAAGNVTQIDNDYRVLASRRMIDPNGAINEVAFDTQGIVVASAQMGRTETGDSVAAVPVDLTRAQIASFYGAPVAEAGGLLLSATTRVVYDLFACTSLAASGQVGPVWAASLQRQRHSSQSGTPPIEIAFLFADGSGGEAQTVRLASTTSKDRGWHATGKKVLNNKQLLVREFEPFHKADWRFEWREEGVSSTRFYDPMGRVVGVLHPDHSWEKVDFDAWSEWRWDANDTCLVIDPRSDATHGAWFASLPAGDFLPTWYASRMDGQLGSVELDAARKAAVHAGTPSRTFLTPLGKSFLAIVDNRATPYGHAAPTSPPAPDHPDLYHTRTEYDVEGNVTGIFDAMGRTVTRMDYAMVSVPWRAQSPDNGVRLMIHAVDGLPTASWDAEGNHVEHAYDTLRRPRTVLVAKAGQAAVAEQTFVYGEQAPQPDSNHLRGRLWKETVQNWNSGTASVVATITDKYDWRGAPVLQRRTVPGDTLSTTTEYDVMGRVTAVAYPGGAQEIRTYSLQGLLESVVVRGKTIAHNIRYNARGQIESMQRSGGVTTRNSYDRLTYRLSTVHSSGALTYQTLRYAYDPVGNPTCVADDAQTTIYHGGSVASPEWDYTFDSAYRLIQSQGREHLSSVAHRPWPDASDSGRRMVFPADPRDLQRVQPYTETFTYDAVGNLREQRHTAPSGSWTRQHSHAADGNRLLASGVGSSAVSVAERFAYNANGCMLAMPHLSVMAWNYRNELVGATHQNGIAGLYAYDASGQRAWKKEGNLRSRSYFGAYEHTITTVRDATHTIRVMHGGLLLAIEEWDEGVNARQTTRTQLGTLNSPTQVEVAADGRVLSYEELYAYGGTAFQGITSAHDPAPKRYRHAQKERDELTGCYYYGGRYYPPWLGCWISPDPAGVKGGTNIYQYNHSNPVGFHDPDGKEAAATTSFISSGWTTVRNAAGDAAKWASENNVGTRAVGALQVVGGFAQAAAGVALATATGVSGVGLVAGVAVAARGFDNAWAGYKTMVRGEFQETKLNQALKTTGMSDTTRAVVEFAVDVTSVAAVSTATRNLAAKAFQREAQAALAGVSKAKSVPDLGSKLEYFLGNATGNAHNIERSTSMLRQLKSIGLHDTAATRKYLTEHLTSLVNDAGSIARIQDNGRVIRESLIVGRTGVLKFETVWDGAKLITGKLIGGR